jgi:hypothetical protein
LADTGLTSDNADSSTVRALPRGREGIENISTGVYHENRVV